MRKSLARVPQYVIRTYSSYIRKLYYSLILNLFLNNLISFYHSKLLFKAVKIIWLM